MQIYSDLFKKGLNIYEIKDGKAQIRPFSYEDGAEREAPAKAWVTHESAADVIEYIKSHTGVCTAETVYNLHQYFFKAPLKVEHEGVFKVDKKLIQSGPYDEGSWWQLSPKLVRQIENSSEWGSFVKFINAVGIPSDVQNPHWPCSDFLCKVGFHPSQLIETVAKRVGVEVPTEGRILMTLKSDNWLSPRVQQTPEDLIFIYNHALNMGASHREALRQIAALPTVLDHYYNKGGFLPPHIKAAFDRLHKSSVYNMHDDDYGDMPPEADDLDVVIDLMGTNRLFEQVIEDVFELGSYDKTSRYAVAMDKVFGYPKKRGYHVTSIGQKDVNFF